MRSRNTWVDVQHVVVPPVLRAWTGRIFGLAMTRAMYFILEMAAAVSRSAVVSSARSPAVWSVPAWPHANSTRSELSASQASFCASLALA